MKDPLLLFANAAGEVMNHHRLEPTGRTGMFLTDVHADEWIPLPKGATMTWLPGTKAIGVNPDTGEMESLPEGNYAVGALLPQGFTRLYLPGYVKSDRSITLPLFGYTAVAWIDDAFHVAAHPTDDPELWNPDLIREDEVEQAVAKIVQSHEENRLFTHLSHCALEYGCMTAKNTFLGRLEGALPVSSTCNAACVGCISEQPENGPFPSPQTRLTFRPTVDELVDVMLTHIRNNPNGIVSFGQGCEGEPATRWADICRAIKRVRACTSDGYININTNAGLTKPIQAIVDAGLNMMRVSTISALEEHYNAYYQPRGYTLQNVATSLQYAAREGVYTSINYLVFPGVTDREEEVEAMAAFLRENDVKLVQMRNLNIDAEYYLNKIPLQKGELLGMQGMIQALKELCPAIEIGSYSHVPPTLKPRRSPEIANE